MLLIDTSGVEILTRFCLNHLYIRSFIRTHYLKFNSSYRTMPPIDRCASNSNTSCLSSLSNRHIRRQLIVSTTNSSRSMNSSDFSPKTMSSIYQSTTNPYLAAVSNDTSNLVSFIST